MKTAYIVSAVRTAIGDFGGSLKDFAPAELAAQVISQAVSRAGIDATLVQHMVIGQAIQTVARDTYLARVVSVNAGIPVQAPALTLNRLCGSGLQAIISSAQLLSLDEADIVVAGGAEVMSRARIM